MTPPAPASAASQAESVTVYAAGLVQGIALVTFPAASTIFTAHGSYDLSSSQYGLMFVPQVITAVGTSLLGAGLVGPGLATRHGEKPVYLAGLLADLAAMLLLIASWLVAHQHGLAYGLLLAATACLGAGFGLAVPALNTLAAAFHPGAVDRSVLVLNALLGLGTALAPVFVAVFVGLGFWTGLPWLAACLLVGLFVVSLRLPLRPPPTEPPEVQAASPGRRVPAGVIACYQVGYGIAAFGVGPLDSAGVGLPAIFGGCAAAAAGMGLLSFAVVRGQPSTPAVHPRPAPPAPSPAS